MVLTITPTMERSVSQAFQEFNKKNKTPELFRGRLSARPGSASCLHRWKETSGLPKDHADYLQTVTEEEPPVSIKWCGRCGAVSYWEDGSIWLYDATTRFFGKPPKRRPEDERRLQ
jgi:hypothetical protein